MIDGLILDTGPLVAYLIERDDFHDWAVETFRASPPLFWTCEAVLTETAYLIGGHTAGMRLIDSLLDQDYLRISFRLSDEKNRVVDLMEQYRSRPMSLADACLVRMAEQMERCPILTLDADFRFYRKNRRQVIRTIMPPGR